MKHLSLSISGAAGADDGLRRCDFSADHRRGAYAVPAEGFEVRGAAV